MAFQFNIPDFDRADLGGFGKPKIHPTSGALWDPVRGIWMSPNSEQRVDPTTGETIGGGMLSPEVDPVQAAVDQATGGNLAQEIMAYLGGDQADVYREDYDIDGDGEISIRDSIYQMQTEGGLRNPDGTPVTTTAPVFPTETEPGMDMVGPAGTVIDPVQDAVDAAMGGAGAGGDPKTDFAPVNNPFEPVETDYLGDIVYPDRVDHTGTGGWDDPNAPGPDPTHYDYDAGTYNPPVDTGTTGVGDMPTTNAVDDMTVATGGFPANPAEGEQFTDATGQTWISIQGQWVKIGDIPLSGDTTVTTDPTVTDPTVTDPTVTDPTVTDPTVTGQSEIDKLNALIAKMEAEQAAQQAKQKAEREAWEAQTAAATGKYTLTGPSIGYNPYVSGQYQSDPYGAAGVPNMGGLTTIPVPDPLQPWQPPTQTSNPWGK